MRYVTIAELSDMIRHNLWKIPHDIDLVVGIPRSGLMAANLIALYLNKRLSDIDSFINGNIFECGERGKYIEKVNVRKVLVIDDSVGSGSSMTKAKAKLVSLTSKYDFVFASPIVTTLGEKYVDVFFEVIDDNRDFEWNIFHHSIIENCCFDIDGVLCCNPEEDDDGKKYETFLKETKPLFAPSVTIDSLVTCRLEKYRRQTEEWLHRNKITYRNLIMLNLPDKYSRDTWGKHGEYKGEYYKNSDCQLFIESSYYEASIIARVSNKPVLCIETNELLFVSSETKFKKTKRRIRKHIPHTYQLMQRLFTLFRQGVQNTNGNLKKKMVRKNLTK